MTIDDSEFSTAHPPAVRVALFAAGRVSATVIWVAGEIDAVVRQLFAAALAKAVELGRRVVVDLTDCQFLDAFALSALLRLAEQTPAPPAIVCRPGTPTAQLITAETARGLRVMASRAAALQELRAYA